jgi:hypothetical protein
LQWRGGTGRVRMESQLPPPTEPQRYQQPGQDFAMGVGGKRGCPFYPIASRVLIPAFVLADSAGVGALRGLDGGLDWPSAAMRRASGWLAARGELEPRCLRLDPRTRSDYRNE